jgi:hypothetical protein
MARSYSDPSYGSKKELSLRESGVLNGTASAAAELMRHTFMAPVSLQDANLQFIAGGTNTTVSILVGKSAAGTGTVSNIGTIAIGTQAIDTVKDGAVTVTSFSTGDDLVISRAAGTSTTVENVVPVVSYIETYEVGDN